MLRILARQKVYLSRSGNIVSSVCNRPKNTSSDRSILIFVQLNRRQVRLFVSISLVKFNIYLFDQFGRKTFQ